MSLPTPDCFRERPFVADGAHPVESTRYIIATPLVEDMCAYVAHLVRLRNTGAIIYAPPRSGKSRALEMLRREVSVSFPGMPVVLLPAWDYTQPREKSFFSDLLTASGHALNRSGTADVMRDRLVDFLATQAGHTGDDRVLLIVDEAQNLHPKHYSWLIGIHNMLNQLSVNLIVLLVGQEELLTQRAAFARAGKQQIVGRFMLSAHKFRGVRSEDDLQQVLAAYDENTVYPSGSGWSFTRYYAPTSFSRGWRLAKVANEFWQLFDNVRRCAANEKHADVPMQYICRTVEYFLTHLCEPTLDDESARRMLIEEAVSSSGYRETFCTT